MRYAVQYLATASSVVYVEAEDEAAAIDAADLIWHAPTLGICCSGGIRDDQPGINLGDWFADESETGVWAAEQ